MSTTPAIKTKAGWEASRLDLGKYLQPGDVVDEAMYYYFLEVLPPACMTDKIVQIGEPASTGDDGRYLFATIEKNLAGQWVYRGHRPVPEHLPCLYHGGR